MNCDQSFFSQIKSEKSAYWLGFIAADGCVSSSRNTLQIKLSLTDILHLENFRKDIKSKIEVKRYSGYSQFRIDNKFVHSDLNRHGIVPRKSLILSWNEVTRNIKQKYMWHFIRGYFDGDGCWATKGSKSRYRNSVVFTITTGSFDFGYGLTDFLNQNNIGITLYSSRNEKAFRVQTCKLERCRDIYHKMYDGAQLYLERKREKAQRLFGDNL